MFFHIFVLEPCDVGLLCGFGATSKRLLFFTFVLGPCRRGMVRCVRMKLVFSGEVYVSRLFPLLVRVCMCCRARMCVFLVARFITSFGGGVHRFRMN